MTDVARALLAKTTLRGVLGANRIGMLHTFDGAQGTDLACLVRRLKARLRTPKAHLCCVGTSATMGDGSDRESLLAYVRDTIVPLNVVDLESDDPVVKREAEGHERALLYVAATRAKKDVLVTGFGARSRLLSQA